MKYLNNNKKINSLPSWQELPLGGKVLQAGNSNDYQTGNWSENKIHWDQKKCKQCNMCSLVCPDNAILKNKQNKMIGISKQHCKGCSICIQSCPFKALYKN